jgi:hypothetical protein
VLAHALSGRPVLHFREIETQVAESHRASAPAAAGRSSSPA